MKLLLEVAGCEKNAMYSQSPTPKEKNPVLKTLMFNLQIVQFGKYSFIFFGALRAKYQQIDTVRSVPDKIM